LGTNQFPAPGAGYHFILKEHDGAKLVQFQSSLQMQALLGANLHASSAGIAQVMFKQKSISAVSITGKVQGAGGTIKRAQPAAGALRLVQPDLTQRRSQPQELAAADFPIPVYIVQFTHVIYLLP
jgi:hypothetical protein